MRREGSLIRVYGDSLSMPRAITGLEYYETYPEIICDTLRAGGASAEAVTLYNRSFGGEDMVALYRRFVLDKEYFGKRPDDVLIIQCGIVDCAPRPVPVWLNRQISKLPGPALKVVVRFLHKNRPAILKMGFAWRKTSTKKFLSTYIQWLTEAAKAFRKVYVVNIMPTSRLESHSPGLTRSIDVYNRLITDAVNSVAAKNVCLIDAFKAISGSEDGLVRYIAKDGYHLTPEGHKLIGELLMGNGLKQEGANARVVK